MFHHHVSELLYFSKQARPDIQTSVSYLCTIIYNPDIDDMKKIIRTMKYLRLTQWIPLTLELYDLLILKQWVDTSYAIQNDFLIHTGSTLSLGKGSPYLKSSKRKLNTKSYTEAKLDGLDDMTTMILRTRYFMEAQGYHMTDNIVIQDN